MAKHQLEKKYGLTAAELLDAVNARFRLKVALEGAVAEFHMEKHIRVLAGAHLERYETHDLDGHPDFSLWLRKGKSCLLAECKNIRESGKEGGEGYRSGGKIVAYKIETQKTRAAKSDPTSRLYGIDQFHILGVCLGKKTGNWADFLFARTLDLQRDTKNPHKLAVFQRVPLPGSQDLRPWYDDLGKLLAHFGSPPWH
ncbi:MAG: hypothetical protein SH868_09780 [Bythopirellula sp.]|nr:hypothetical protein [Bythopirellula sp.]